MHCAGIVVRELARRASNWRSEESLDAYLRRHRVPGLAGIDTRRLTRHLRDHGALPGAFGTDEAAVRAAAADGHRAPTASTSWPPSPAPSRTWPRAAIPTRRSRWWPTTSGSRRRSSAGWWPPAVASRSCPASTKADDVLARRPDGVFLSNGPGDPAGVVGAPDAIRGLLGEVPVFGICLGHQLLGLALGRDHHEAPVRAPRCQPPRPPDQRRRRRDHQPEPQLRRRRRLAPSGEAPRSPTSTSTTVSSRASRSSASGPSRCSTTPRRPPARTTPPTSSTTSPRSWRLQPVSAEAHRPREHPRHRIRPDRHRAGLRVRLLRHPGLPGAAPGGLPGRPRQLQPGHDHDRPRAGRRHLHRAARPRHPHPGHREGAARRPAPDAGRPDGPQPGDAGRRGRGARPVRRGADRRRRRGHPHRRGPAPLQGRHDRDRPVGARSRASPTRSRRRWPSARRSATR